MEISLPERIFTLISNEGRPMKASEIARRLASELGVNEDYSRNELARLARAGRLERPKRGYYQVPVSALILDSGVEGENVHTAPVSTVLSAVSVGVWTIKKGVLVKTARTISVAQEKADAGWEGLTVPRSGVLDRFSGNSYEFQMVRYAGGTTLNDVYEDRAFADGPYVIRLGSGLQVLWLKEIGIGRVAVWNRDKTYYPIFSSADDDTSMTSVEMHAEIVKYSDVP